jgi:hypothetical protein
MHLRAAECEFLYLHNLCIRQQEPLHFKPFWVGMKEAFILEAFILCALFSENFLTRPLWYSYGKYWHIFCSLQATEFDLIKCLQVKYVEENLQVFKGTVEWDVFWPIQSLRVWKESNHRAFIHLKNSLRGTFYVFNTEEKMRSASQRKTNNYIGRLLLMR